MANETMKQVAVRMPPKLHGLVLKGARRTGETFGEFVRRSVSERLSSKPWEKRTDETK